MIKISFYGTDFKILIHVIDTNLNKGCKIVKFYLIHYGVYSE